MRHQLITFAAAFTVASSAHAYSAGPHHAATSAGLQGLFKQSAIDAVYIANFQVDYMYQKDSAAHCWHPNPDEIGDCAGADFKDAIGCTDKNCHAPGHQTQYFHFDDYPTGAWIERGLIGIERAARKVALQARKQNNPRMVIDSLGIALHAIQDMYSHSSIPEQDWHAWTGSSVLPLGDVPREMWTTSQFENLYSHRTSTGFDIPQNKVVENQFNMWNIPAGAKPALADWPKHGPGSHACKPGENAKNESCGINHDSVLRSRHLHSLLLAIAGTRDLAQKVGVWLKDETFWQNVKSYDGGKNVAECNWRARRLSNLTGEWGYPTGAMHKFTMFLELIADDCSDNWQDNHWSSVLNTMYHSLAEAPKHKAADPALSGTYAVVMGDKIGTLSLDLTKTGGCTLIGVFPESTSRDGKSATLVVDGKTWTVCAVAEGLKVFFKQVVVHTSPDAPLQFEGEFTLMSKGKNTFAGFTRMKGIPNGFWGKKIATK